MIIYSCINQYLTAVLIFIETKNPYLSYKVDVL